LKKPSFVLHILPCGNQGSFEYNLCMLKKDGVEKYSGNRFYFEDKSHFRRLTAREVNELAANHGFYPVASFYSNHLYGAIDWITLESPRLILLVTSKGKAKNIISVLKLISLRAILLAIKLARFPANAIDYKKNKLRTHQYYLLFLLLLIFYPFSKSVNMFLHCMSDREWENKKNKSNGSEMYLFFRRN